MRARDSIKEQEWFEDVSKSHVTFYFFTKRSRRDELSARVKRPANELEGGTWSVVFIDVYIDTVYH